MKLHDSLWSTQKSIIVYTAAIYLVIECKSFFNLLEPQRVNSQLHLNACNTNAISELYYVKQRLRVILRETTVQLVNPRVTAPHM